MAENIEREGRFKDLVDLNSLEMKLFVNRSFSKLKANSLVQLASLNRIVLAFQDRDIKNCDIYLLLQRLGELPFLNIFDIRAQGSNADFDDF